MEDSQASEASRPCGTNDPQHDKDHNNIHTSNYEHGLTYAAHNAAGDVFEEAFGLVKGAVRRGYAVFAFQPAGVLLSTYHSSILECSWISVSSTSTTVRLSDSSSSSFICSKGHL
ncbi:hypothetical protein FGLOB1_10795 [Fusarium globosum]|uniref:Uncharacterized protein n=1 Tax=Fusarium globosum TaxID=78864 RepID=A0A8H5XUY6_9HYPO|nr:hypothetical protein FGLOB1_10795 [Fusarium globosum]